MRETLTEYDIKELRYQCRMGYLLPSMIFIIGNILTISIYGFNFKIESHLNYQIVIIIVLLFAILSIYLGYRMNWKYLKDIRNNEKVIETKIIQLKELKKDYEAGSGTLYIGQEMKDFDSFSIFVDNFRYRVEKELFLNCNEGDEVNFNYGPVSRYLINIELKKSCNNSTLL